MNEGELVILCNRKDCCHIYQRVTYGFGWIYLRTATAIAQALGWYGDEGIPITIITGNLPLFEGLSV